MKLFLIAALSAFTIPAIAKTGDTIRVEPATLELKNLQKGDISYLQFGKKTKDGAAIRVALIKFNVQAGQYHNKPAITVTQQWEMDTIVHKCLSVFNAKDFSTLLQDAYWKRLGYSVKLDFETREVSYTNLNNKTNVPDSVKSEAIKVFNGSFNKYNLNWHADMLIYSLLPFKENRVFIINYYDPGFEKSTEVAYTVTGSDYLTGSNGEKIDCRVLNNYNDNNAPGKGYERFWISKKTHEVLKLENNFFSGRGFRYKLKLGIAN
ncbi:DUF3108 domain-containing protein [Mucilaginibacter flavidus]|uniref:DUF3108 domain-containing protein n=1 Tax=Mucilaginibacter flavidus TaxID=2949309 RepID=UPI0020936CC0|nr:hypothetical protein [Mucilaginibacter flavidus]MCO5947553.1 hypothetical protein [Mucilaginibacter flavidus]